MKRYRRDRVVGVNEIHHIKEIVDDVLLHSSLPRQSSKELPPLDLPKVRKHPDVEILPISVGCLGACTFCQTRLSRGVLCSYPEQLIVDRVDSVGLWSSSPCSAFKLESLRFG